MSQVRRSANGNRAAIARLKFLHAYWSSIQVGDLAIARCLPIDPPEERPPPCAPMPFVLNGFHIQGGPVEIVCYLPGQQPIGSLWWDELGAWFVVRRCAADGSRVAVSASAD